jgi:membrane-associated phospholipid phosphatase
MPQAAGVTSVGSRYLREVRLSAPLLAPAFRPVAAALAAVCAAVVAFLAAEVAHQSSPGWLDSAVDSKIQASLGGHAAVLTALTRLGGLLGVTVIGLIMFSACLGTRRYRGALLVAVALPVAGLAELLLKPFIDRTRYGWLSFPSGHTIGVFALAVTFLVILTGPLRPALPSLLRVLLGCAGILIACAVAVSLIALRVHYFTDTIGGAAVSISIVLGTALIVDFFADRRGRARDLR